MTPLAAQPNERTKRSRQGTQPELTPRQRAYGTFFRQLVEDIRREYPGLTEATKPTLANWFSFPVGRSGVTIAVAFGLDSIRVALYLAFVNDREKNKRAFDALVERRQEVEEALGYSITWDRQDDKKQSRVFTSRMGSIDDSPKMLAELREWAVQKVGDFYRVFRPLIQQLDL